MQVMNAKGGAHQWNVTDDELAHQKRFTNYSDIVYAFTICFTKISILLLVLRLFCPRMRDPFYWGLQTINVTNTLFYICFFFVPIFACSPREKIWHPKTEGKCMQVFILYIFSAAFNAFSDMAMFFVPLWRIWNLSISRSRKWGISTIFLVGTLYVSSPSPLPSTTLLVSAFFLVRLTRA